MQNIKLPGSLVTVQWLANHLSADNLVLLDASMPPLATAGNPTTPSIPAYIPGSLRFDFDREIRDKSTSLPHMMPTPEFFTDEMQKMGINRDSAIVVYDDVGIYASPRAWWMFRAMGHDQVAVLDGGLPAWVSAGLETSPDLRSLPGERGDFVSKLQPALFVDSNQVLKALNDPSFSVLDARSEGRFKGLEPEPRPGLRGGHMPNSVNLPYARVVENGLMSSETSLHSLFQSYKDRNLIFSCGSGVTACILALAAERAGLKNLAVYDGSWSEWGLPSSNMPVETG